MTADLPQITITLDESTDLYILMARSYGMTSPAGPRLFRGGDVPNIEFRHQSQDAAEDAAGKLRTYLDSAWDKKAPKEKKLAEIVDPVWEQ